MTVHLLAEQGLPQSRDEVAARARAGRSSLYRRWPDMSHLITEAFRSCSVVPPTPDTGSTRSDLLTLLAPWNTG